MSLVAALALVALGQTAPPVTPNALPYTLTFQEVAPSKTPLPGCHSYAATMLAANELMVIGGRAVPAGLHQFRSSGNNFPTPNNIMMVIDPTKGTYVGFDVTTLPWHVARVLMAANAGSYYDSSEGNLYVMGGYGPGTADQAPANYATFGTMLRFNASAVASIVLGSGTDAQKAAKIGPLIQSFDDSRLAVTGANLFRVNGMFYLMFGQTANGMYEAFGGGNFQQSYNCQIAAFKTKNDFSGLLTYGPYPSNPDYHRRDGNSTFSLDPASGNLIIAAFGGVFPPGIIGAYTRPIYFSPGGGTITEATVNARFGGYECPNIVAYSAAKGGATYHTLFGGIGHYFVYQTPAQAAVYKSVTAQGRNDGLPFIGDIGTFVRFGNGSSHEWVLPSPIPAKYPPPIGGTASELRGAGAEFFPNSSAGAAIDANGVIQLDNLSSGSKTMIGTIYGGIEAANPLPVEPNTGTTTSNALYQVWLTKSPCGAIDAKYATAATGTQTPRLKELAGNKPTPKRKR